MNKLIIILQLILTASIAGAQSTSKTNELRGYHEELNLLRTQYADQQEKLKAQYAEALQRLHAKVDKNTPPDFPLRTDLKDEFAKLNVKADGDWYTGIWDVTLQTGRPMGNGYKIDDTSVTLYNFKIEKAMDHTSTKELGGRYKRTDKAVYAVINEKLYIFTKHSQNRLKIRVYDTDKEEGKFEEWYGTFVKAG